MVEVLKIREGKAHLGRVQEAWHVWYREREERIKDKI